MILDRSLLRKVVLRVLRDFEAQLVALDLHDKILSRNIKTLTKFLTRAMRVEMKKEFSTRQLELKQSLEMCSFELRYAVESCDPSQVLSMLRHFCAPTE